MDLSRKGQDRGVRTVYGRVIFIYQSPSPRHDSHHTTITGDGELGLDPGQMKRRNSALVSITSSV